MSDSTRRPCRPGKLSTHYLKYSLSIESIDLTSLDNLHPEKIKENTLKNFKEFYLYFDDCTINIKKRKIILHIKDIITNTVEDAQDQGIQIAFKYTKKLKKISKITNLQVHGKAHYARVCSILSKQLIKVDDKYKLTFSDGVKLWIDYSNDKTEDETNNAEYRERIDNIFTDARTSQSTFSDVDRHEVDLDKIKNILLLQIQLKQKEIELQSQYQYQGIELNEKRKEMERIHDRSYFG